MKPENIPLTTSTAKYIQWLNQSHEINFFVLKHGKRSPFRRDFTGIIRAQVRLASTSDSICGRFLNLERLCSH